MILLMAITQYTFGRLLLITTLFACPVGFGYVLFPQLSFTDYLFLINPLYLVLSIAIAFIDTESRINQLGQQRTIESTRRVLWAISIFVVVAYSLLSATVFYVVGATQEIGVEDFLDFFTNVAKAAIYLFYARAIALTLQKHCIKSH